jgi:predicted RND superfamily exporter protein
MITRLEAELPQFVAAHMLHVEDGRQSWRISTRAPALGDVDYGVLLENLRNRVDPLIRGAWEEYEQTKREKREAWKKNEANKDPADREPLPPDLQPDPGPTISATYTGLTPLVYTAQRALLHDLILSFLTALALVTLVMILVQRSLAAGFLAMAPNVFPSAILFGAMGWLGFMVDIGTVMTASVALGIAVDGTLHFLTWYRSERGKGRTPTEAVERTYRHCGVAMTQTTLICGLGLLVFTFSGFLPTRKFAIMMVALLTAALVGDLVLLPALLMSPLGKLKSLAR